MASGFDAAKVLILFELGVKIFKIQPKTLITCTLNRLAKGAKKFGKKRKKRPKWPECKWLTNSG